MSLSINLCTRKLGESYILLKATLKQNLYSIRIYSLSTNKDLSIFEEPSNLPAPHRTSKLSAVYCSLLYYFLIIHYFPKIEFFFRIWLWFIFTLQKVKNTKINLRKMYCVFMNNPKQNKNGKYEKKNNIYGWKTRVN